MAKFQSTEELLEKKSIRSLILRLGIPAMFGQFFNMLYSIVDRIFVGQIPNVGDISLASIGICAPALTAITAFAYMIGIGGATSMSISLGQKNKKKANEILGNAFLLLLGISFSLMIFLFLTKKPLLYLLGCSNTMFPYAHKYFSIYCLGILASLCGIGLNQFLLAQGYSKQGMIAVIIGALVNVTLDPLFIFYFHKDVSGAAIATVISQFCMAAYVFKQVFKTEISLKLQYCKFNLNHCKRILSIGFMSFLITLLDNLIIILLNIVLRKYGGETKGDQLITYATVIQSFMTIVCCPAQGITSGCSTIFSYHYGAKHYSKIRKAFTGVLLLCGGYIGILWISVQLFPQIFVNLFLNNMNSYQASQSLRMYTMALIGIAIQYAFVDGLTAMGKISLAFPLSLFRKCIYIISIFVIPLVSDVSFVFLAGTISDAIGAIFTLVFFYIIAIPKLKTEF